MLETPNEDVVTVLQEAADDLVRHNIRDLDAVLTRIVALAVQMVPGSAGGCLSRADAADGAATRGATDRAVGDLDRLQLCLEEGPSWDAVRSSGAVFVDDLASADFNRWPSFRSAALRAGFSSVVAVHLATPPKGVRSALTLYARSAGAFTEPSRAVAGLFASQASLLLYGADQAANLQRAVASRDVIGQAKGMLMERFDLDSSRAFELLVTSSQETNLKLADVAGWLTGEGREGSGPDRSDVGDASSGGSVGRPQPRSVPDPRAGSGR